MEILTDKLAEFITNIKYKKIPMKIRSMAKERVLDILSATFAGSALWEHCNDILNVLNDLNITGNSLVIGKKQKASFIDAAFINAAFAHSIELDDGHKNAGVHAGAVVVPVALSLGEQCNTSGKIILDAIVAGYEIAYRFAINMCPELIDNGFHPSAICDTMASAAVASVILNLNKEECANALALSAMFASGLMEVTRSGQSSKGAMVGHAASSGIRSAIMAKHSFKGPDNAFYGKFGIFKAMAAHTVPERLLESLDKEFLITDTYVKLYPTCRHTHASIEGIAALRKEYHFSPFDVSKIRIGTFPIAYDLTGRLGAPETPQQARFSTPYCTCVSLITGTFGINDLKKEKITSEERQKLTKLISVYIDNEVSAQFPQRRGAKIQVTLKNGHTYEKSIFELKGSPDVPIGFEDLKAKFYNSAKMCISKTNINKIIDLLINFEEIDNIKDFVILLS